MICDHPVTVLAIFEVLAIPSELREAVWEALPPEKYGELQGWAIALLLNYGCLKELCLYLQKKFFKL